MKNNLINIVKRKPNSYPISANMNLYILHSTCGKKLFRNPVSKQNVVTLNSSRVHILDNLILPTQRIGFFYVRRKKLAWRITEIS